MKEDEVNHPKHYAPRFKSKELECVNIPEKLPFSLGNAFKYVWRAGSKGGYEKSMQDLDKALYYLHKAKECGDYAHEKNLKAARIVWNLLEPDNSARWHVLDYLLYPHMTEPEGTWWEKLKKEVSEEALKRVREESLYNKMNKVLQLYKGYRWECTVQLQYDAGGEYVPVSYVFFGKEPFEDPTSVSPIVVDKNGEVVGLEQDMINEDLHIEDSYYTAGDWSYETAPEEVMNTICDELLKRKESK